MAGQMYFGNRSRMIWVKCPDSGMGFTRSRWSAEGTYLNGGGYVRESTAGHLVYEMGWNFLTRDQAYAITDYRDGIYGSDPLYFLDPFHMNRNVLPQHWAAPALAGEDAMPLVYEQYPVLSAGAANALNAPAQRATYTLDADSAPESVWVPVPDGYSLHIGGLFSVTGTAAVRAIPNTGSPVNLTPSSTTTAHNFLTTVMSGVGGGVELSLSGIGTVNLWFLGAQVLPNGRVPTSTTFFSGQGTSGSRFVGDPSINGYSAVRDHVALSVRLKETGAWDA